MKNEEDTKRFIERVCDADKRTKLQAAYAITIGEIQNIYARLEENKRALEKVGKVCTNKQS